MTDISRVIGTWKKEKYDVRTALTGKSSWNIAIPLLTADERAAIARQLYTPIEEWETRILRLERGSDSDELCVTLQDAVITHAEGLGVRAEKCRISYEAVPYT